MLIVRDQATRIANAVDPDYGIDPTVVISVLNILVPMFARCFASSKEATTPKEFLLSHYDQTTDTFDQWLIERARGRTRLAANRAGKRGLDRGQLDAITEATFRHAIGLDDATMAQCMDEVARTEDNLD